MKEFYDRLVNIAMPRIKDFRGYSKKSFDGQGNITIGIKDHIIFPEISVENVENILNLLTEFLCRMDQTLFQTSS